MSAPKSEVRVYVAQFEDYEGWGIREQGKSPLDMPDDFTDSEQQFVLLTDHDQEVKALKAEIDRLNNKYDFQLLVKSNEALKEDFEKLSEHLNDVLIVGLHSVKTEAFKFLNEIATKYGIEVQSE